MLRIRKDRVLIQIDAPSEMTASGLLWLPDTEGREPAQTGIVLAIGAQQMEVTVGERVAFHRHAGIALKEGILLDAAEILGIVSSECEEEIAPRIMNAFDGERLKEALGVRGEIIYCYYSHMADTFYICTDKDNPNGIE